MESLAGKVVLITGANRGLGKGIARALADVGAKLTIAARDSEQLEQTAIELRSGGGEVFAHPVDVAEESQVETLFAHHMEHYSRLDILINNAGAFDGGLFHQLTTEAWDNVMNVNLRGPFLCGRAAFRIMLEQNGGRILNIGSISGQRPRRGSAPYTTSKFGMEGLTQSMALDGRKHGIVVSCLHPGNILTERRAESTTAMDSEPMMTVDEVAEVALTMVSMPPHINMLSSIVLPVQQKYLGRG